MPEIPASLAEFATRELRGRGIEIRTGTTARLGRREDSATLSTGERDPHPHRVLDRGRQAAARGARARPAARPTRADRGRRDACGCEGHENVWAIGDAAAVPDPAQRGKAPAPADRPARAAPGPARGRQRGRRPRARQAAPFRYKTLGVFVDMGQHQAVATMLGRAAARLPGLVRGPHLPPGDDAGHRRGGCGW